MNIKMIRRNRRKCFFLKIRNRLEDTMLSLIQVIPEKLIPRWLMKRLEKYLDKRISELKQQSIQITWYNAYLQNAVDTMRKSK